MLSASARNEMLAIIKNWKIESNYPALLLLYKILRAIIAHCPDLRSASIGQYINSPIFQGALNRYSEKNITDIFRTLDQLPLVVKLCVVIHHHNLHNDYISFFKGLSPGLVSNWHYFENLKKQSSKIIDCLLQLHQDTRDYAGSTHILECNPYTYSSSIRKVFPDADDEDVESIWDAVMRTECDTPEINDARVKKAIKLYASHGKSKDDLLANYLLEFRDLDQHPIHFESFSISEQEKIIPTKYLDESAVNYHNAGKYLALDIPTDVLEKLYYKDKCDPDIECTLLINQFLIHLKQSAKPLIINPSPHLLIHLAHHAPDMPTPTIIVPTRQMALVLSTQFRKWIFESAEDWPQRDPIQSDLVLISCPSKGGKLSINEFMQCFAPMANCKLIVYTSEHTLVGKLSTFLPTLKQKEMQPYQIILAPQELIATSARHKIILIANACSAEEAQQNVDIPIYHCLTTDNNRWVSLSPDFDVRSLASIWRNHSVVKTKKGPKPKIGNRNQATLLQWSLEIVIAHSIYMCPDGYRTRAYIQRLDNVGTLSDKRINGIPGESCSEVYLRAVRKGDLLSKIWNIPLREDIQQEILRDVIRVYGHRPEDLTIKTTWLCLRQMLLKNSYYNDDLAKQLFCGPDQSLANLRFNDSFDHIKTAFQSVLESEHIPIKHWTLLRQIVELATRHGFLAENPLDQYAPIIEAQGRQKVYSITDSVRKWCFSSQELDLMIDPLIAMDAEDREGARPYMKNSQILLKLFAVFSFATRAELLALNHCDMIDLPNGGVQALITKYVNNRGQIEEYDGSVKERRKRRKVALPPFIATCYHQRVAWIENKTKIIDIRSKAIPIFMEAEPKRYSHATIQRCTLKTATTLYNELVYTANIPDRRLMLLDGKDRKMLDLGLPRKTENLFRNHLMIAGTRWGLEDGEMSYCAGTMPEATIDAHYIGYDAPQNQIAISAKLHRMSARYCGKIDTRKSVATKQSMLISTQMHKLALKPRIDQQMSALIEILPKNTIPSLIITIKSNFGHRTTITAIEKENYYD